VWSWPYLNVACLRIPDSLSPLHQRYIVNDLPVPQPLCSFHFHTIFNSTYCTLLLHQGERSTTCWVCMLQNLSLMAATKCLSMAGLVNDSSWEGSVTKRHVPHGKQAMASDLAETHHMQVKEYFFNGK
jgi:hypothetical protein